MKYEIVSNVYIHGNRGKAKGVNPDRKSGAESPKEHLVLSRDSYLVVLLSARLGAHVLACLSTIYSWCSKID